MTTDFAKKLERGCAASLAATNAATQSIGSGKVFPGAYAIADMLGYETESFAWNCAVAAAFQVYSKVEIITDENNIQV